MPDLSNPTTGYAKEVAQFDQPNYNPALHPYPKMLYIAERGSDGKFKSFEIHPPSRDFRDEKEWERACMQADAFNARCQKTVYSKEEHKKAAEAGWMESMKEAVAYQERLLKMYSDAAAEGNYTDRRMSDKAKAEKKEYESEHFGHQPEIPEKPKPRKGRRVG